MRFDLPKNLQTMKYWWSLSDPMVLLFVGSSYALALLVGCLYGCEAGQVTVGNLVTFISYLDMLVLAFGGPLVSPL